MIHQKQNELVKEAVLELQNEEVEHQNVRVDLVAPVKVEIVVIEVDQERNRQKNQDGQGQDHGQKDKKNEKRNERYQPKTWERR